MDPNVADMKYNELRQYAKDLGISNYKCPKPKKDEIIEAIRVHMEQQENTNQQEQQQKEEKSTKRKITKSQKAIEFEESIKTPTKTKKTKKTKEKISDTENISQETVITEAAAAASITVTPKKNKKVKKSKNVEEPIIEQPTEKPENNEENAQKIKKVKKIKEKKMIEESKPIEKIAESTLVKKTPGRPRKKPIITEKSLEDQPDAALVVEEKKSTENIKKTKTSKKNAKEIVNEQELNQVAAIQTEETNIIKKRPIKKVKKVVKKKKSKSSSSLKQQTPENNNNLISSSENQIENTVEQNNVQDDFQLRLEKDDDEFSNHAPQQVVTTTTVTTTVILSHSPVKLNDNESIMTNDESFHQQGPKTPQHNKTPQFATLTKSNRKSFNKASTVLNEILDQQDQIYNSPARPTRRSSARKSVQPEIIKSPIVTKIDSQDLNITNDIQNTTFDKSIHEEENPVNSQALPCNTFYKSNNITQDIVQENNTEILEKPKPKGARIVRPTQTVTCVIPVVTEKKVEEEVVSKKVEIIRREAGPRIVKPAILSENEIKESSNNTLKRKVNTNEDKAKKIKNENQATNKDSIKKKTLDSNNNNNNETKSEKKKIKIPNFKAIHEKAENKLENITDYVQRKADRMRKITGQDHLTLKSPAVKTMTASKIVSSTTSLVDKPQVLSKAKTPMSTSKLNPVSRLFNYNKSKTPLKSEQSTASTTPKINKCQSATTISTNIPRLALNNNINKKQLTSEEPKTPSNYNAASTSKTPSSTRRLLNGGSALLGSIKKSIQTFKFGISSSNSNEINLPTTTTTSIPAVSTIPSMPPISSVSTSNLLATSSFNRRKSYDLGLRMQLEQMNKDKTNMCKIKPIDFGAKSAFLSSNCDDSNKIKQSISTSSFRKSILGSLDSNSYHPDLKSQIKSQNLKKINFESTQQIKKVRSEKVKMHKDADLNKKRNIEIENTNSVARN